MEIIIIFGAIAILYFATKSPAKVVIAGQVPTPATTTATAPPPSPVVPAPVPAPADAALQGEIAQLQGEITALTPKPVDPLAPKPAPVVYNPIVSGVTPAMTAQQAFDEAKTSETNLNPRDFANQTWLGVRYREIEQMHTLAWEDGVWHWSGAYQPGPNLSLIGTGTSMALQVGSQVATSVGSGVASAIPFIGAAVSGIIGLFGAISAHHRAAVTRDSNAFNQGLTAAENYLLIIKNAVASGQSTPDEGRAALDSLYSDFLTFTAPARNNSPYCNSVCEAKIQLNAVVIYWKSYYEQLVLVGKGMGNTAAAAAVVAAAPKAPTAPAVGTSTPLPAGTTINPLYKAPTFTTAPATTAPQPARYYDPITRQFTTFVPGRNR